MRLLAALCSAFSPCGWHLTLPSCARVIPRFFVENAQTRQFVRVSGAAAKKLQQAATERQVRSKKGPRPSGLCGCH